MKSSVEGFVLVSAKIFLPCAHHEQLACQLVSTGDEGKIRGWAPSTLSTMVTVHLKSGLTTSWAIDMIDMMSMLWL